MAVIAHALKYDAAILVEFSTICFHTSVVADAVHDIKAACKGSSAFHVCTSDSSRCNAHMYACRLRYSKTCQGSSLITIKSSPL